MSEPTLFDAELAKDIAIAKVEVNADHDWKISAMEAVRFVAKTNEYLTSELVWKYLSEQGVSTHEPRAIGAIMTRAAREHIIIPTDQWQKSTRVESHRRPMQVWKSLVYG